MQRVCARCIDKILILMQCVCAMYGEDFTGTKVPLDSYIITILDA
jgi:hypothetical protein